ncbi:MAG: FMN-binding protein, partial [Phocaeicola sp.]
MAKDIFGYGGNVPLNLYLKEEKIDRIELLKNAETPNFLDAALRKGLLTTWNGLTLNEVLEKSVDAVSGATLSSLAIIESVERAAQFGTKSELVAKKRFNWSDIRFWIALLVLLAGMILPLFYKNK